MNRVFSGCLLCASLLALLSCSRQEGSPHRVIAVVPKGQAHVFWQSVHAGAAAAGREMGVTIEWNGPASETEYSKQVDIVENFLNRHVDGILLAPTDRKALVGVIEKAKKMNVPVTIFDSGADTESYVSFVATDNYAGGQTAARRMGELLKGKGIVAIIAVAPGSASTLDREKGFQETLAKEFPGIHVADLQYGMSDRARSLAVAEDLLTAHPNLTGIFASNESSTVGAAQALKARGLAGKIQLVGFDSSTSLVEDLKAGVIDSLVVQNPYRMGYEGVKTLVDQMAGRTPPRRIDSGAVLVKRDDLGKPDIQKLLNPELKF